MEIRPATPEDVPQMLPMVRKVAAFHEAADPAKYAFRADPGETYRNWLRKRAADPRSVFLVADARAEGDAEPRLIGFLVGTVEPEVGIYRIPEFGFIHDVWVDERYRHEGIARQLVALTVERFRAIGMKQVRLDVLTTNDPARGLFASSGFRPSVTEMLIEL